MGPVRVPDRVAALPAPSSLRSAYACRHWAPSVLRPRPPSGSALPLPGLAPALLPHQALARGCHFTSRVDWRSPYTQYLRVTPCALLHNLLRFLSYSTRRESGAHTHARSQAFLPFVHAQVHTPAPHWARSTANEIMTVRYTCGLACGPATCLHQAPSHHSTRITNPYNNDIWNFGHS